MTESEQLILTLRESRHETTERIALDPARYPALQRVLLGPDGETIRHEMEALLIRFRRPRAQRHQVRMLATLVVPEDHREREEAVLVEDISLTGVRVALSREVHVDIEGLASVRLPLRVGPLDASIKLHLECEFVRVASMDKRYTHLAFRFKDTTEAQRSTLDRLQRLLFS